MKSRIWGLLFCLGSLLAGVLIGKETASRFPGGESGLSSVKSADAQIIAITQPQHSCTNIEARYAKDIEALRNDIYQLSQFILNDKPQLYSQNEVKEDEGNSAPEVVSENFKEAIALVRNAEQYSEWTNQDAENLRKNFDTLTKKERFEIMRQLSVAVNKGHLQPQSERFPF